MCFETDLYAEGIGLSRWTKGLLVPSGSLERYVLEK